MRLGTAIEHLVEAHKYASDKEWIQDKVAWALYHTWKDADRKTESDSEKPNNCETCKWWEEDTSFCYSKADSDDHACHYEPKDEPTISKMEQVDKDINVRSKDEPQTSCKTCRYGEVDEGYVRCAYYSKSAEQDEPQTERSE